MMIKFQSKHNSSLSFDWEVAIGEVRRFSGLPNDMVQCWMYVTGTFLREGMEEIYVVEDKDEKILTELRLINPNGEIKK